MNQMNGASLVHFTEHDNFRSMDYKLIMSILDPKINFMELEPTQSTSDSFLKLHTDILSPYDMDHVRAYADGLEEYSPASVLFCIGVQRRDVSYIEGQMKLERPQILTLLRKVMKKLYKYLSDIASKEFELAPSRIKERVLEPHNISVDEDLNNAAKQVEEGMKAKMEGLLNEDFLQRYAIVDKDANFDQALLSGGGKIPSGGHISVKSSKPGKQKDSEKSGKKRGQDDHGSKSKKKHKSHG
ncbi:hypothetical protein EZV62_015159 [Acer yangbiense]|uniref:Possible tRNA binding domain-containing protein n=1 Tax=Acer yangbiense TaxID=1000413 RepID=A0A5C7HW87_9ROSI|nr:hypothetical protein EZV62_015159 [Acer yangbiense]